MIVSIMFFVKNLKDFKYIDRFRLFNKVALQKCENKNSHQRLYKFCARRFNENKINKLY